MKKFLRLSLYFVSISFLTISLFNYLIIWTKEYDTDQMKYQHIQAHSSDVMLLGNSKVFHGLRPSYFKNLGETYNYGYPGAGMKFFTHWYKQFITPLQQKPHTIILHIDRHSFGSVQKRSFEIDSCYWSISNLTTNLSSSELSASAIILNHFPILSSFEKKKCFSYKVPRFKRDYESGFVAFSKTNKPLTPLVHTPFIFDTQAIKNFKQFVKLIRNDNIHLILISLPEYGQKTTPVKLAQFLGEFCAKNNTDWHNFNSSDFLSFKENPENFSTSFYLTDTSSHHISRLLADHLQTPP